MSDEDGLCYYCGKMTNSLAGNPEEWAIPLCHADAPGRAKPHHIGCVSERLARLEAAEAVCLAALRRKDILADKEATQGEYVAADETFKRTLAAWEKARQK